MKKIKLIFGLLLASTMMLVGCGGGSQSVLSHESPEAAVARIANSWRASGSPSVVVDKNGNFVRQANESASGSIIKLTDLAGDSYDLVVQSVESNNEVATVICHFVYDTGYLNIVFGLIFDENKWWLNESSITDNNDSPETGLGISGYIRDASGAYIPGALVQAFLTTDPKTVVGECITKEEGFYEIEVKTPGSYILVVARDGFEQQTLGPINVSNSSIDGDSPVVESRRPTANCRLR